MINWYYFDLSKIRRK